jgi:hypothetical protein
VIGVRDEEVKIADPRQPVIFMTGSGFYQEDCPSLKRASRAEDKPKAPAGRPRAIPARLIPELLQRHDRGEGYRMLSRWLKRCGIDASPAACRRAALGMPPYTEDYG